MRFRVVYELTMDVNADGIKDVNPSDVAACLHDLLDDYEDGRHNLAWETLQALTRSCAKSAVYSALTSKLFARYGNRFVFRGGNAVSSIAQKRLLGVSSRSYVKNVIVEVDRKGC